MRARMEVKRLRELTGGMSIRNDGPSAIECEANVLSRELDGDQDQTWCEM